HLRTLFSTSAHTPHFSHPSLHDALPILFLHRRRRHCSGGLRRERLPRQPDPLPRGSERPDRRASASIAAAAALLAHGDHARRSRDRKSTRLNSSHEWISYAVFCLKKKIR